jgi:tRNA(fMet)-specific endonuclease VapC
MVEAPPGMLLIDTDHAYISRAPETARVSHCYRMFEQVLIDFNAFHVLVFDAVAATVFDSLRAGRVRVATMDLRIASIAIAQDLTLLTRNAVDFGKVPGLRFEDWTI